MCVDMSKKKRLTEGGRKGGGNARFIKTLK
jgi:hypothetical protein